MTDNTADAGGAPSKEQMSSAEDFLNNGDFSQSPKLAEGFKDILDNKQNFNFEVKDIGGGQYQAKASSVFQQDDPNFQKAVSVDLNENDVKKLNDLNQDRVKAEASSSNTNTAEPNKPQSTQNTAEVKPEVKPTENKKEGAKPDPNADMKSKLEGLKEKRDDFANKVKAIGSAEGKEGKFKAVMEAYKAGKELKKEGNKLDKEMKGKQSQKKGKSSSSSAEKDEDEEIGSLYAALMAIINGMKDLRKQVKEVADKEKIELPKPQMNKEDKQFMKEYPAQRQELQGKHQDTLKQMTDMDNKFKTDGDKLNKDFDKKIADERAKNEGDPSKVNALIDQKNAANKQLHDNYLKDRGGLEKQADGLKDQTKKLDERADKIQNNPQANKPGDMKSKIEGLAQKRDDFANKVKAIGSAEGKEGKFKAVMEAYKAGKELKKEGNKLDKEMKGKQSQKKGKSSSSSAEKDEDEEIGSLYAALMAIINGMKDLRKQVKEVADKEKIELPKPQMNKEDKQFMKEYPAQRQELQGKHNDTLKQMTDMDNKFKADGDKLNKDFDKKIADERAKNEGDPSKVNALIDQKNAANKQLYDNYIKDRGGLEKQADGLKDQMQKLDQKADKINNPTLQVNKPDTANANPTNQAAQKASGPEQPKPGTDDSKKELGQKIAQDSVKETVKSGGQPEVGVAKAVAQNAGGIANEAKATADNKGGESKPSEPKPAGPSMPGGEATGASAAKPSGAEKPKGDSEDAGKKMAMEGAKMGATAAISGATGLPPQVTKMGVDAGASALENKGGESKSSEPSGPKSGESKSSGLASSFQGVADKISQAGNSLKGGQGGDANDIGNALSQAITQLSQGLSQLGDMSKKLSSGGDDKAGGPSKPQAKGGGGSKKPEEDAVPGQEGQELADALKAIGDGIKEMGQTLSKMSGKEGAKEGGKKSAKGGGEKEEDDKKLEPGDPSAAINAVVEGIQDLIKQISDLGKQLTAGAGMQGPGAGMQGGPGGGDAPKGPGGGMPGGAGGGGGMEGPGAQQMKGGPSGGMQGPGGGGAGGQSPGGGGMNMQAMGGDVAGGAGAPPMPRDKDAFKNEDGKTKDTNEIGKEVGKDFAKEMADPSNGGQPEIAAVKVLIKDGPALMEAAKSKMEENALAPVGVAKDVANSMNSELEKAGNPTTQTYDPANQAAAEESKNAAKKQSETPKPEPTPESSSKASPNKPK